jgi:hypothetical protein
MNREVTGGIQAVKFLIEKSPSYMLVLECVPRIKEYNPDAKIIVSLRNPITRALSRYQDIKIDEPHRIKSDFYNVSDHFKTYSILA